jgi:hypothetical protein
MRSEARRCAPASGAANSTWDTVAHRARVALTPARSVSLLWLRRRPGQSAGHPSLGSGIDVLLPLPGTAGAVTAGVGGTYECGSGAGVVHERDGLGVVDEGDGLGVVDEGDGLGVVDEGDGLGVVDEGDGLGVVDEGDDEGRDDLQVTAIGIVLDVDAGLVTSRVSVPEYVSDAAVTESLTLTV